VVNSEQSDDLKGGIIIRPLGASDMFCHSEHAYLPNPLRKKRD
jgi:hypothetical protein